MGYTEPIILEAKEEEVKNAYSNSFSAKDDVMLGKYIGAAKAASGKIYKFWNKADNSGIVYKVFFQEGTLQLEEKEYIFGEKTDIKKKKRIRRVK